MKLALRIVRTLSTHTNQSTNLNLRVASLIDKFEEQLIKDADLYELPLSKENSILAYTNRFAKSVINLENITPQKKKRHFKAIKQSMLRNNKFTPRACIGLCESLVHFPFDGDESRILQMLRNYAAESRLVFNTHDIDRFNLSYKYLMVDKLTGPIKFVNFELLTDNLDKSHSANKLRYLLQSNKIKVINIKDWLTKREMQFELRVGEKVRRIKVKTFKCDFKADEQELIARQISKLIEKDQQVMLVKNNSHQQYDISAQQLSRQLLVDNKNWHLLDQFPLQPTKDSSPVNNLVSSIKQKIKYQNEHLKIIEITPMNYLNSILTLQSQAALKQLFGYVKFNTFHAEIEKLLHLYSLQNKKYLKQMFPLSFATMLQIEQQNEYQFMTPQMLAAKSMVDLMVRTENKTFNLFLNEESVYEYLYFFINYAKSRGKEQLGDQNENRDIKVVKNKLALASILYCFNLNMPVLESHLHILRKTMFPLTFQYRHPQPQ